MEDANTGDLSEREGGTVLLVGSDAWRERVRPYLGVDAGRTRSVATAAAARAATDAGAAVAVVVAAQDLPDESGLALLASLRERGTAPAFVLAPRDEDGALAARAVAADVDGYVPADPAVLAERLPRAVEDHRERTGGDRPVTDEALASALGDPNRVTLVLSTGGTVRRANETARDLLADDSDGDANGDGDANEDGDANGNANGDGDAHGDRDAADVAGRPLWSLAAWADDGETRQRLQRAVSRAADGAYATAEVRLGTDGGQILDCAFRPVGDGTPSRVVVEGTDVTERVRLQEELARSEQLHRVTLNNMTDTILITDDEGRFTYVCPNVHFIFGYSAQEIRELGTIDELLGEDLFDRAELEANDVLTNIERTAVDKAGNEHTLLVNVRTVSIQGGTTLISCRDVTKRKQREQALTRLHRTSRALLYAETELEIAERIVADATSILPVPVFAVYRIDPDENALRPVASSPETESVHGPLHDRSLTHDHPVVRAFVENETVAVEEPPPAEALDAPSTALRSAVAIPLGEHGVLLAGAPERGAFDDVAMEVAELLAAAAEAALDRVERERTLRSRDRRLQQQNQQLTRVNQVNELIRGIDRTVVSAETREEIEHAVCEQLTESDRFAFAWIGAAGPHEEGLRPTARAGGGRGYLDGVALSPDGGEPALRTAASETPTLVSNVTDELRDRDWSKAAVSRDFHSVLSVPLSYDGVLLGTLTVYADRPDAFDGMVQSVLAELGATIASAINAVERKEALVSDAVVELEYRIADPTSVFHRLARAADCTVELEGEIRPGADDLVFVSVDGATAAAVVAAADDLVSVAAARAVEDDVVELRMDGPYVTSSLADHGAAIGTLRATPEATTMTVEVGGPVAVRTVDDVVSREYDDVELLARRERADATATYRRPGEQLLETLTPRQLEVARVAYRSGYFDSPRRATGEEIAASLDISDTAFYEHVRAVQDRLFAALLDGRRGVE